ncbi:unnamed protein product [Caenorhabditis nigoni]
MLKNQICVLKILDFDKDRIVTLGVVGGEDGGLGGIIGGGNGGGIGGIVGDLLGGNQDVLQDLLGVLGGNPGGLGLPILGNITGIPSFLTDILRDLPDGTIQKITDLLGEDLPISQLLSRLGDFLPGGVLEQLLATVADLVSKLLEAISNVLSNLQSVFDQLSTILNNENISLEDRTKAIDDLRQQFPVEMDTIYYIASQVEKTLQGENGGVVPELPEVPSVPETPEIPV